MAGYAPAAAATGAALRGVAASHLKGAQALAAACHAGRPGVAGRKPVWGSWVMFPGWVDQLLLSVQTDECLSAHPAM